MSFVLLCFIISYILLHPTSASTNTTYKNNYPIVLVHGFAGWGRGEVLNFKYWGGLQKDIQEELKKDSNQPVFTVAVGPFSSNWDRACELYAQIKGGRVDYGQNHSSKHHHERYGRNYTGLFPQWGKVINGEKQKVHFIGHSMGGQTVRVLAQLLADGTRSPNAPTSEDPESHRLFKGDKDDWIHSITTIATPNEGTLLADGLEFITNELKNLVIGLFNILGIGGKVSSDIYDAKLDQWHISPRDQEKETLMQYLTRVFKSKVFQNNYEDIAVYDLSAKGSKKLNTWVETQENIFYYSYASDDTHVVNKEKQIRRPNVMTMLVLLDPLSLFLGGKYPLENGYEYTWQENDGIVNTYSMFSDGKSEKIKFDGTSRRGKWHMMELLQRMDHLALIGVTLHTQIYPVYLKHCNLLWNLPSEEEIVSSSLHRSTNMSDLDPTNKTNESELKHSSTVVSELVDAMEELNLATSQMETFHDLEKMCKIRLYENDEEDQNVLHIDNYCKLMMEKVRNHEKEEVIVLDTLDDDEKEEEDTVIHV